MKNLSRLLDDRTVALLRKEIARGRFPGVRFEQAMQFFLTDGIVPAGGLPARSFILLEDWIRGLRDPDTATWTASELKNRTGEIIQQVLEGKVVRLTKHGRAFAEIRKLGE